MVAITSQKDDITCMLALTAQSGVSLTQLWPLSKAQHLDNDAKYAENLEVRMMRTAARLLIDKDVTMPDAEFVYEGAEAIPGRPQDIVDALLQAADAYDTAESYEAQRMQEYDHHVSMLLESDCSLLDELAQILRVKADWSQVNIQDLTQRIEASVSSVSSVQVSDVQDSDAAADMVAMQQRVVTLMATLQAFGCYLTGQPFATALRNSIPVLMYLNIVCERIGVPRTMFADEQWRTVVTILVNDALDASAQLQELMRFVLPHLSNEWERHREDVLWDPQEAKKLAQQEDERKSREALAAKFAHIQGNTTSTQTLD